MAKLLRCAKCGTWLRPPEKECSGCGESSTGIDHKSPEYATAFYSKVCCVTDKFHPKGGLKKIYVKKGNNIFIYWVDPTVELDDPNETIPVYSFRKFLSSIAKKRKELENLQESEDE